MTKEIIDINATRLLLVDDCIKEQVQDCLARMHKLGQPAIIHSDVWRSPENQLDKFRRGVSKVQWGYHCATRRGKPASLACDIVHADLFWFDKTAIESKTDEYFWLCLGHCADEASLDWGGYWFGDWNTDAGRAKINFLESRTKNLDVSGLETKKHFGWDVAHVEVRDVSIDEARNGWRIYKGNKFKI